jgi:hypothetical protein
VRLHDLRHRAASLAHTAGVDIKTSVLPAALHKGRPPHHRELALRPQVNRRSGNRNRAPRESNKAKRSKRQRATSERPRTTMDGCLSGNRRPMPWAARDSNTEPTDQKLTSRHSLGPPRAVRVTSSLSCQVWGGSGVKAVEHLTNSTETPCQLGPSTGPSDHATRHPSDQRATRCSEPSAC